MSENRFKIVFDGALLPGVDVATAKLNIAELFKSDVEAIERLFSGHCVALKRDLSQADAQTYLQALKKTGIDARIEAEPAIELNLSDVHEHHHANDPTLSPAPQSPYAPPQASVGETLPEFATLKPFSIEGRIGRLRFLAWTMVLALVMLMTVAVFASIALTLISANSTAGLVIGGLLAALLCVAFAFISIQISVQRLHDIGWSGWLWLLSLVPFVGSFFPFVLMIAPGNNIANRYGAPPPPNSTAVKVLSSLWVAFIAIMFFAGLSGGISTLRNEYESATETSYDSGSVTTDDVEVEPAESAEQAPNSTDDAAEAAQPPVDSAKE
ncbi:MULTISPECIES: DUF805 domain-containing protein [unclassified Pseudomonas]|uniref:DUF805 domain-containing protein n=1 Tax=unclassified Pseudomonas TaxID=196821 RepID=UPI002AC9F05B|nr:MULTISPECIES: DUF805 domain-containing protein [unclassified Pseudomonas]MEB0046923.1 DUF805 domain-containing protein [Pseudomonas sp. Dout3]MEB0098111.1 DUF805 domain-containing protein [Pseudomonas sp. DC1.2]WPX58371.1 DUF805 domain-containing protein [Pseudomonas sp. DC1.2]